MRTDKQSDASRNNGAKSDGPVTEEGKTKSARNSMRHNLSSGHIVLLSNEDPDAFRAHSFGYLDRFAPADPVERDLVNQMIAASWRLARISAMECALVEIEMDRQRAAHDDEFAFLGPHARQTLSFFGNADHASVGVMLLRYQSAARRSYATALRMLKELQGDRFGRRPASVPEQPSANTELPNEPEQNPVNAAQENDEQQSAGNYQPKLIAFTRRASENRKVRDKAAKPSVMQPPPQKSMCA